MRTITIGNRTSIKRLQIVKKQIEKELINRNFAIKSFREKKIKRIELLLEDIYPNKGFNALSSMTEKGFLRFGGIGYLSLELVKKEMKARNIKFLPPEETIQLIKRQKFYFNGKYYHVQTFLTENNIIYVKIRKKFYYLYDGKSPYFKAINTDDDFVLTGHDEIEAFFKNHPHFYEVKYNQDRIREPLPLNDNHPFFALIQEKRKAKHFKNPPYNESNFYKENTVDVLPFY